MTRPICRANGFSLVELAIVLMVIGLLVGGVLKGRDLIDNARVNSLVMQAKTYESATRSFKKMYGELPGDFREASTRLPNCSGAAPCTDGGGDGLIGTNNNEAAMATSGEPRAYWLHLAKAGLLPSAIDPEYTGTPNTFGRDFPATPFGGGISMQYWNVWVAGNWGTFANHFLRTRFSTTSAGNTGLLTAAQAAKIDRKIDDGLPNSGNVISSGTSFNCFVASGGQNIYPETNAAKKCDTFFRMNF